MSVSIKTSFLGVIGLVCLAACGGGGNGGGGGLNPGGGTGPLAPITVDNAPAVAGVVMQQVMDNSTGSIAGVPGLPIVSSGGAAASTLMSVAGLPMPPEIMAAQQAVPQPCDVDGMVDVDFTVRNPLTLSEGDEFRFEFDACDDGLGTVLNGNITMTVTVFEGNLESGLYRLGLSVEVGAFSVTQDGVTTGATGTIGIEIDTLTPPLTTITVSTSALTTTRAGVTETVTNLSVTVTEDASMFPTAVTVRTSFRVSSPRLGGDVVVSTSIALQSSGEEYPFVGELEISGAGNSVIVLIAIDSNTVRLEIDVNGDGATDDTVETTWGDLMAAADAA